MQVRKPVIRPIRTHDWTLERVAQLSKRDIEQLRLNAETLGEAEVVALCAQALKPRPGSKVKGGQLISRTKAFEARGVSLQAARSSWSGVRKSDGAVVMGLWAGAVESSNGGCNYLLWAPNVGGSRPWSDMAAGQERLEHCRLALERGGAEGLLVYGDRLDGRIPEDKARSVRGVDPEAVVHFHVEQRGEEYWAVWAAKTTQEPAQAQA
jgi:hypothetical protein